MVLGQILSIMRINAIILKLLQKGRKVIWIQMKILNYLTGFQFDSERTTVFDNAPEGRMAATLKFLALCNDESMMAGAVTIHPCCWNKLFSQNKN